VLFGIGFIIAPLPQHRAVVPLIRAANPPNILAKGAAERAEHDAAANKTLTPIYPANPGGVGTTAAPGPPVAETTGAASRPNQVANMVPGPDNKGTQPALETSDDLAPRQKPTEEANVTSAQHPAAQPTAPEHEASRRLTQKAAGNCAIQACASAYRSFRASDCSYQPFKGPRRACVAPEGTQTRNGLAPEFRSRRIARGAINPARVPRYEKLRARDDSDGDATDAPMDDDRGGAIFFQSPRGWFR
jgi:hypothetical protein